MSRANSETIREILGLAADVEHVVEDICGMQHQDVALQQVIEAITSGVQEVNELARSKTEFDI